MPEHYNAGDRMPEGVLLLDPATGLPVPTPAQGLTDAQLRATAVPVAATARACLGTFRVSVTTASQTLAQLINTAIPAGAVTCEIQPDGGTIRIRRDALAPTTTLGLRVDDGVEKLIDTPLSDVRAISAGASNVPANVIFFDLV